VGGLTERGAGASIVDLLLSFLFIDAAGSSSLSSSSFVAAATAFSFVFVSSSLTDSSCLAEEEDVADVRLLDRAVVEADDEDEEEEVVEPRLLGASELGLAFATVDPARSSDTRLEGEGVALGVAAVDEGNDTCFFSSPSSRSPSSSSETTAAASLPVAFE
jgi:hypothetical protein